MIYTRSEPTAHTRRWPALSPMMGLESPDSLICRDCEPSPEPPSDILSSEEDERIEAYKRHRNHRRREIIDCAGRGVP